MKTYLSDLFYFSLLFIATFSGIVGLVVAFNIFFPVEATAVGDAVWNFIEFVLDKGV